MRLSEYERKVLLASPIYQKYATLGFSSVTLATILTDLDGIAKCNIDNLPLIKFLTQLAKARGWSQEVDYLSTIDTDTGNIYSQANIQSKLAKVDLGDYTSATGVLAGTEVPKVVPLTADGSGVISNGELTAAVTDKVITMPWYVVHPETLPATALTLNFHDQDGVDYSAQYLTPSDCGKKRWCYYKGQTGSKKLEVDVSGAAANDVLAFVICHGSM